MRGETRELEIELTQGRREIAARGVVIDEQGAPLAGVELAYRGDERWAEDVTTDELGAFECWAVPCDSVWIGVDALASAQGDPPVIELELAPGLVHSLRVFDGDTGQPLAGVRFTAPDLPAVLTDSDGWAHLSAQRWSVYSVELEGYEPEEWNPSDSILFDWGPVYLSREP